MGRVLIFHVSINYLESMFKKKSQIDCGFILIDEGQYSTVLIISFYHSYILGETELKHVRVSYDALYIDLVKYTHDRQHLGPEPDLSPYDADAKTEVRCNAGRL